MFSLAEEDSVAVLEDDFDLYSDGKDYHGHNKTNKYPLAGVFTLIALLDFGDKNKKLF